MALSPDRRLRGYFHGTSACLSALYHAERYDEVVDLVVGDCIWPYKRWAVMALAAKGKKAEALRYAENCRGPWTPEGDDVDALCEEILLSSGLVDEAYERYALRANRGGTYLATFRAVAKGAPHKDARQLLSDLVNTTPGNKARWFAAAEAGLRRGSRSCPPLAMRPEDPRPRHGTSPRSNRASPSARGSSRSSGWLEVTATRSRVSTFGPRTPTR